MTGSVPALCHNPLHSVLAAGECPGAPRGPWRHLRSVLSSPQTGGSGVGGEGGEGGERLGGASGAAWHPRRETSEELGPGGD